MSKSKKALFINALFFLFLGLSYLSLFIYFDYTNQLPIKSIKIIGSYEYVKEESIQKTLTPFILKKGLFAFEELQAEKALEKLPGVQSASIWRLPPDKIRVIIREKSAIARLVNGALLAADGSYFEVAHPQGTENLPVIAGNPRYIKQMLAMMQSLQPIFNYDGLTISGMGLSENGDWSVQINHEAWLILGKKDLPQRVANFLMVYPVLIKNAPPGETPLKIDLRYPNGMAVSWQNIPLSE